MAYSKFKSLPLYLEWAPINTFTKEPKAKSSKLLSEDDTTITTTTSAATAAAAAPTTSEDVKKILLNDTEKGDNGEGEDDTTTTPTPVATLFVKNLNFDTTEPALKEAFIKVGGLQSVRIVTKPDKKNAGGKPLSMGFGFLEFQSRASALQAVKTMQGFKLDGHALELKFSNAAAKSSSSGSAGIGMSKSAATVVNKGTKLIVRNIPFEATKRDIQQLFR